MKRWVVYVCSGLFLALVGCGGGGGGGGVQPVPTPEGPAPEKPQPEIPPPVTPSPTIDFVKACANIVAPGQGADINNDPVEAPVVDASPGGFFTGTFTECETIVQTRFSATVSEGGVFRIHSYDGGAQIDNLLTGSLQTAGASFQGSGRWSKGPGVYTGLWLEGVIAERETIKGRWGNEWGSYGFFKLTYTGYYEWPIELAAYEIEPELRGNNYQTGAQITWTVAADGQFTGVDTTGCNYAGQVVNRDPRYILVETEFTVTDCAVAGSYSGFASWYVWDFLSGPGPVLVFNVDDGQGRKLDFQLANGSWSAAFN